MTKRKGTPTRSVSYTWLGILVLIVLLVAAVINSITNSNNQERITSWQWMPPGIVGTNDWNFDQVYELRAETTKAVTAFRMQVTNLPETGGVGILGQKCLLMPGDKIKVEMLGKWYVVGEVVAFERGNFVRITIYLEPALTTAPEC